MIDINCYDFLRLRTEVSENLTSINDITMFSVDINVDCVIELRVELDFDLSDRTETDFL